MRYTTKSSLTRDRLKRRLLEHCSSFKVGTHRPTTSDVTNGSTRALRGGLGLGEEKQQKIVSWLEALEWLAQRECLSLYLSSSNDWPKNGPIKETTLYAFYDTTY